VDWDVIQQLWSLRKLRVDPTKTRLNLAVAPVYIRNFLPWLIRNPHYRSNQISYTCVRGTSNLSLQATRAAAEGKSER